MTGEALVVGATGYFGRILVEDILTHTDLSVVVASRRRGAADALAAELSVAAGGRVRAAEADLDSTRSLEAAVEGVFAAVCAAGPFHRMPLSLLDVCLRRHVHYLDLADDRGFVRRAREMGRAAQGSVVCSGWSAAPALTAVLARIAAGRLDAVDEIRGQIAPGNRAPRRAGTVASLLHSAGRPFRLWDGGKWRDASGWSEPRSFQFGPPVGERAGYLVDVPDHEIFPELFGARSVSFRVGAELSALNAGMSLLAGCARAGATTDWSEFAPIFCAATAATALFGHDWGAVGVEVGGTRSDRPIRVRACVTAAKAGQRIPALPAAVTLAALKSGRLNAEDVTVDRWIDRAGLERECARRGWALTVEEH